MTKLFFTELVTEQICLKERERERHRIFFTFNIELELSKFLGNQFMLVNKVAKPEMHKHLRLSSF